MNRMKFRMNRSRYAQEAKKIAKSNVKKEVLPSTANDKEQCQSCYIWTGGVEESELIEYRGVRICGWCLERWYKLDVLKGRETSFQEALGSGRE